MRVRHSVKADIAVSESRYVINDPETHKGKWAAFFGNGNPIHIEIGMGKGRFLMELAARNPEINYIGIERVPTVLYKALRKQEELMLPNIILISYNADNINDIFDTGEIDRIYLNFSDPWPKDRHAKRRLTSPNYLAKYNLFLKKDGHIEFKTDNRLLFDYTLEAAPEAGWQTSDVCFDLHASEYAADNIMTEYEEKFSQKGTPINRVILKR